ncbi:MAG: FeoB-associated Cys-rich membrane protein [Clostridia bacterium]|nr:FeoB-associated Cys-rich membrane protein [Clostridia bacterium]
MNLPTIIVASIVAAIVIAIVVFGIRNKKKGKSSCSCGGNCGACKNCQP